MCCDLLLNNITNHGIIIWSWSDTDEESYLKCKRMNKMAKKMLNKRNPLFNKEKLSINDLPFETTKLEEALLKIHESQKNMIKIEKTWIFNSSNGLKMKLFSDPQTNDIYMLLEEKSSINKLFDDAPVGFGLLQINKTVRVKISNIKHIFENDSFKNNWNILVNNYKTKQIIKNMLVANNPQVIIECNGMKFGITKFTMEDESLNKIRIGMIINQLNNNLRSGSGSGSGSMKQNNSVFKHINKSKLINDVELQLTSIYGMLDIIDYENKNNFNIIRNSCDEIHEILSNYYYIIHIKDGTLEMTPSYFDVRKLLNGIVEKYSDDKVMKNVIIDNTTPPVLYCDTNKINYFINAMIKTLLQYTDDTIQIKFKMGKLELYNGKCESESLIKILSILSMEKLELPENDMPLNLLISWYIWRQMKGRLVYKFTDKLKVKFEFETKNKELDFGVIIQQYSKYYQNKKILISNKIAETDFASILHEINAKAIIVDNVSEYLKNGSPADVIVIDLDTYRTSKDPLYLRGSSVPIIGITSLSDKKIRHKRRMLDTKLLIITKPVTKTKVFNTLIDMPYNDNDVHVETDKDHNKDKFHILVIGEMDVNQKILVKKIRDLSYPNIDVLSDISNAKIAINNYNVIIFNINRLSQTIKDVAKKIKRYAKNNNKKIVIIGVHNAMLLRNSQRKELYAAGISLILESSKDIKSVLELVEKKI